MSKLKIIFKTTDRRSFVDQAEAESHQDQVDTKFEKRIKYLVWNNIGINASVGDTIKAMIANKEDFRKAFDSYVR